MSLPAPGTPYPPPSWQTITAKYHEWSAWWEGDNDLLTATYAGGPRPARQSQYSGGVVGAVARFFWGKPLTAGVTQAKLHLPVAADLATTSAEQVYSSMPTIDTPGMARAAEHIEHYLADGLAATLMEGAESGAVFGGRFQAVTRDPRVHDGRPFLTTIHADQAFPEFVWGELVAVNFVWQVDQHNETVLRHVERHELDDLGRGIIVHALYEGSRDNIGQPVALTEHPSTAELIPSLTADGVTVDLPLTPGLWCAYIPNMRPQRAWRTHSVGRYLGRSDFSGVERWFDEIDHAYSEWVADLDLSRGRLIIDEAFLNVSPDLGGGTGFDLDRRIFTPVGGAGDAGMKEVQFAMRVNELAETIDHFTAKVIQSAGWSQATFGEHSGDTDITATEIRAREKRTLTKRARRINEERTAIKHLVTKMLALDGLPTAVLDVEWSATVTPDSKELAETAHMLRIAGAASRETLVRMVHPEWDEGQIREEVVRMVREESIASPSAPWEPYTPIAGDD